MIALLVLVLSAVPAEATSQGTPAEDPPTAPWSVDVTVNASVVDSYARVAFEASLESNGTPVEVPLEVPVPDDAYITGMSIERNGTVHEADVEGRERAKQGYREAKGSGQTAGLVEQERSASVYAYRVNVAPGDQVNATLTYETYLTASQGVYGLEMPAPRFPTDRVEGLTFRASLSHTGGLDQAWATPNATTRTVPGGVVLERTVEGPNVTRSTNTTVHYTLEETPRHGELLTTIEDGTGYFAHRFRAAPGGAQLPLDLVLVLDTSGSMGGLKVHQLRRAAKEVVDVLDAEDRLHLTLFDDHIRTEWTGLARADTDLVEDAKHVISEIRADGSTDIGRALEAGFGAFGEESATDRMPALVFLTDGHATTGVQETDRLRAIAREENQVGAHVFSLAFGQRADWTLVHGLAQDGNGTAVHVEEGHGAKRDIERFLTSLTTPVLKHVRITYDGSVEPFDRSARALFAGSEMLVVGTFDANMSELTATVSAQTPDGARSWNITETVQPGEAGYLSRLVAYHRLQALEDQIEAKGGHNETIEDEIRQRALEHGFVTDYTSLVLTLPRSVPTPGANATTGNQTTNRTGNQTGNASTGNVSVPNETGLANETLTLDSEPDGLGSVEYRDAADAATGQTTRDAAQSAPGTGDQDAADRTGSAPSSERAADRLSQQLNRSGQQGTPSPGALLVTVVVSSLAMIVRRRRR